jgi:hypothetical protein
VLWGGDYWPTPEDMVEEFQRRCTVAYNEREARRAAEAASEW